MSKLNLPNVTVMLLDNDCPALAKLAVEDTLAQIEPAQTLVLSNSAIDVPGTKFVPVPRFPTRDAIDWFFWYDIPYMIETEFMLMIQWDGWVIDAGAWLPEFMNYDYVGAPWWDDSNGEYQTYCGLALRSIKLMRFLAEHRKEFPLVWPEDNVLGHHYRPLLEERGFRWPTTKLASKFCFENCRPAPDSRHFMFHDAFNFPAVLSPERLKERLLLMWANPYASRKLEAVVNRRAHILPGLA